MVRGASGIEDRIWLLDGSGAHTPARGGPSRHDGPVPGRSEWPDCVAAHDAPPTPFG